VAILLSACTGTIESSSVGSSGPYDPSRPWVNGGSPNGLPPAWVPGAPGTPGATAGTGAPGGAAGSDAPGTPGAIPEARCVTPAVGPTQLRRMTHREYDNSVRDLLGTTAQPAREFAADTEVDLFDTTAEQTVAVLLADQYLTAATSLAEGVTDVGALVGCDYAAAGATGTACLRGFIERFGRRAYRRPLTADETTSLVALHDATRTATDAETGVRAAVAAILASPNFVFRPEFGMAPSATLANAQELSQFELAGRLATLLWASAPDDALLDAAEQGALATREQVQVEARRMLADPKALGAIAAFYEQWFGLLLLPTTTKDTGVYPAFDDALRASMGEETRRFIEHVLWQDDARLATLLTASYSFVNQPLAALYGASGPTDATTYARVELDPAQRSGILTQASVLTTYASSDESSPVKRGKWVRVRMLCQDLPDPPEDIPELPGPAEGVSTRERFAMHTNNAACSGCHSLIDGLGFGLEHYDGIGAFRSMDHGVPVDASGMINNTSDIDGSYEGGPALAALLAGSAQVRDCAPTQWMRFALGRRETADDTCSLAALQEAFAASDGDLRELMVALTQTDAFWNYRQAE